MRLVKFAATLALGYTLGEFFTGYRIDKTPDLTFGQYTKNWYETQKSGAKASVQAGRDLAEVPALGKLELTDLVFPNLNRDNI